MALKNGSKKGSSSSRWILGLDIIIGLITLLVSATLLLTYFTPYVDPNDNHWFALLGLGAPFLYVANLLLVLYWIIRWKWIAWFPLVVMILGLGYTGRYYRPQFKRNYSEQTKPMGAFRVMSYNVGGFWGTNDNKEKVNRMREIAAYINAEDPDILCLQEYETNYLYTRHMVDSLLEHLPYKTIAYHVEWGENLGWGLAIYSKYKILKRGAIAFTGSINGAMWADLLINRDTVRIYNSHLQTTNINEADRSFLHQNTLKDPQYKEKASEIVRKLTLNFQKRAHQADTLAQVVHQRNRLQILCGDFNDTPISYTYRRMRGGLSDAFQQKGEGMVYTYRGLKGLLRIDYLFLSDDFETVACHTDEPTLSDHNPVIVDMRKRSL